jgi:hypothetical protein
LLSQPAFAAYNATAVVSEQASTPTASTTLQSAATANGNGTALTTSGYAWATLTVNCVSCSGGTTVNFEGTQDGTNYAPLNAVQAGGSTVSGSTTASGVTIWNVPVADYQNIRTRISGYSAGTVTVTATAVPQSGGDRIVKLDASSVNSTFGGAFPSAGSAIGVKNGTSLVALAGDANGNADTDIHGNAGATLDGTMAAGTAPTNGLGILGQFNSSTGLGTALTAGQTAAIQTDANGRTLVSPSGLTIAQGSATSGQTGDLIMGAATSAAPSYTTAQSDPLSLTLAGGLRSDLSSVGGTGAAALSDALGNPTAFAFGSYSLGWDSTNSVWRRVQVDAGTGTLKVDGSGATQPISGSVTANQGGAPWANNITQWDSTALGAPSAYGTSPGAVNVPGVNAYVTNAPTVNAGSGFTSSDNSAFTAGTSSGSNINCVYQSSPSALTSGNSGTAGCDQYRDLHVTATDSAGQPLLDKSAYRISGGPVSSFATSPTDWVVLTGSSTKTVRITNVTVCGLATTATSQPVEIVKRSTADSAGTSTTPSITPLDSGDAAATAAAAVYTANPTVGTQVGSPVDTFYLNLGATGSAGCASLDFGTRNDQALVLRGTSQQAAIDLAGTTVPSGTNLTYRVEWTEGGTSD